MKLDYKKTFLIGFGFFAASIAWSIYNSFVPLLLKNFITSTTLIGSIMTIDNIFGVIFQPTFGYLSDRTKSRYGKRMPYIIIGIPLCALVFSLIPTMASGLVPLMITIILFNLIMSTWRSPVVALMPDLTPAPLRSKANGIINMMGGIGTLIAFAVGGTLSNMVGMNGPFILSGVVMILALLVLFFFVKEPVALPEAESPLAEENKKEKVKLSKEERKSLVLILFAIFFWFTGFNAVEAFFTLYATNTLMIKDGDAAFLLAFFSISFLIAAYPAGILGGKIGRKKTIMIGLSVLPVLFIPMFFINDVMILRILLFTGGIFWACVNINSLPMVVELADSSKIGTYTGYYYFFSFSAAIVSPILFGYLRDLTGSYPLIFLYAAVAFTIALLCIIFVKHGEAAPQEKKLTTTEVMGMQED